MCYMFKVKPWRTELYNKLQGKNGLLSLMGQKNFTEQIEYTWGNKNTEPSSEGAPTTVDIYSFGDMNLWRSHFLNIVSEGQHGVYYPVWITEKTFKPIMGARPLLCMGIRRQVIVLGKLDSKHLMKNLIIHLQITTMITVLKLQEL